MGATHVEKSGVLWGPGLRTALVFGVMATWCVAVHQPANALPLAIGCVFVAFAEAGEDIGRRWRTMAWVTLWIMLAAFTAVVLSERTVLGVLASGVVALGCGIAGVAGPRAALGGVLTLVTFTIFLGAPQLPAAALDNALLAGLGGLVITIVTVAPTVLREPRARLASQVAVPGLWSRIRPQLRLDNPFIRHGIRLSVVIMVATVMAEMSGVEHAYWLPMTIAWVTKPDADGTVGRVAGRLLGTLAGLAVCWALLIMLHVSGYVAAGLCAVAAGLVIGYIAANYAIAVAAITVLVVVLFSIEGDPVSSAIDVRLVATVLAAMMTIGASYIWRLPTR